MPFKECSARNVIWAILDVSLEHTVHCNTCGAQVVFASDFLGHVVCPAKENGYVSREI